MTSGYDDTMDEHADRLRLALGNENPWDTARKVANHIVKQNEPASLFAMGNVTVLLRDDGSLLPLEADQGGGWLAYVAERVDFLSISKSTTRKVSPPAAVMKMLPAIVREELPPLDGVVTAPYLDRDGAVITAEGYHPGSRLVLRKKGLEVPPVSEKPTGGEVADAKRLLTEEWLHDFPFEAPADMASAIAELLTIIGRQMFPLAPLFVNDASAAGSGKGLLTTTVCLIATGEPAHFMELPEDREEQRKTITAALLEGSSVIAWDEAHIIQGKSLAAVVTAEIYSGRLIGSSKIISARNRFTQIALGNNVEARGDMKRRVMPCRLVPKQEHPELRTGFKHPDLVAWVRANRGKLLWAALTLWRNWDARKRPAGKLTMGSFEHWARVIGGVLQAAGISDFGANTADWLSYSEQDDGWAAHFRQLRERFGLEWFSVADVADAVAAGALKRPPIRRDETRELASQLTYAYRGQRETVKSGLWLVRSKSRDSAKGSYTWTVRQLGDPAPRPDSDAGVAESTETSPVSPVSPVFPGQSASGSLEIGTGDESISSSPRSISSESPVDLQCGIAEATAGHCSFTGDTGDTGDRTGPSESENCGDTPARKNSSPLRTLQRSEDDWQSLISAGPGSGGRASARNQPKHQSRAARRRGA